MKTDRKKPDYKKLKRSFKRQLHTVLESRFLKLGIFLIVFFMVSGSVLLLVELKANSNINTIWDAFWWSIITFSTTGYGDIVPSTPMGRLVTVPTIFVGIIAMSILSGTLASVFVDRRTKARRGLMDFSGISDHIIICGWKENMMGILKDIIDVSGTYDADRIVIVSNIEPEKIEELQEDDQLRGLKYVKGDYFSEPALRRAGVTGAAKILVLADSVESSAPSEVDSKTVMTVLTIKAISKDVYVCAELLDRKYEPYLRQAMCDEILFSLDFSRMMLATTTVTNGMSHIMNQLIGSSGDRARVSTKDIPTSYIGKTYNEFKQNFLEKENLILLGLLENTGSPNSMKIEALREAQKTSDVSALVQNLQKVKGLEVNRPVLVPEDSYVIQRHSKAIVLEKRGA